MEENGNDEIILKDGTTTQQIGSKDVKSIKEILDEAASDEIKNIVIKNNEEFKMPIGRNEGEQEEYVSATFHLSEQLDSKIKSTSRMQPADIVNHHDLNLNTLLTSDDMAQDNIHEQKFEKKYNQMN